MLNLERWNNLLERVGCNLNPDEQYNQLVTAYSNNHRAYHNLTHIEQCLAVFDQVKSYLTHPDLVELAIWYHDAVYNTRSSRNEEDSAKWAEKSLYDLGIEQESIKAVHDLVLSTKHADEPRSSDTKYLIDIDLSILGATPHVFQEYDNNIRKEYKWVPTFLFKNKRHDVLRSFLRREYIYYTKLFREKYEDQARININSVLTA